MSHDILRSVTKKFHFGALALFAVTILSVSTAQVAECYARSTTESPTRVEYISKYSRTLTEAKRKNAFDEIWNLVDKQYVYPNFNGVDWAAQKEKYLPKVLSAESDEDVFDIIGQMVADLNDDHSWYLSPQTRLSDDDEKLGEASYVGVGIQNEFVKNGILVKWVFKNSPADVAGLKPRDVITSVEGATCPTSRMLRGDTGTKVNVTVYTPGKGTRDVVITRGPIVTDLAPSAKRLGAKKDIGYLVLPTFDSEKIPEAVEAELSTLLAAGPLSGLIVDVRSNSGGLVWACERVFGMFKSGPMGRFRTRFGEGLSLISYPSKIYNSYKDVPLVVLVDHESHSAAEILAASLQQERKATVIGVPSAANTEGVQRTDFDDGSAIYLAFDDFYLRTGVRLGDKGVQPNKVVDVEWATYSEEEDPMILEGINFLQQR